VLHLDIKPENFVFDKKMVITQPALNLHCFCSFPASAFAQPNLSAVLTLLIAITGAGVRRGSF
jgi:serine/threonine protein kinase